jgi:hypothetical protein
MWPAPTHSRAAADSANAAHAAQAHRFLAVLQPQYTIVLLLLLLLGAEGRVLDGVSSQQLLIQGLAWHQRSKLLPVRISTDVGSGATRLPQTR